jgi:hypothetical protein
MGRVIATTEGEWEGGAGSRSQGEEGKSKDWEKKVMDWAREGRKDHEENGHYLLSHNQKGSWNKRAIGTHTLLVVSESREHRRVRKGLREL